MTRLWSTIYNHRAHRRWVGFPGITRKCVMCSTDKEGADELHSTFLEEDIVQENNQF